MRTLVDINWTGGPGLPKAVLCYFFNIGN